MGAALPLAHRLQETGNEVSVYIKRPEFEGSGVGFFKVLNTWRPEVEHAELIISDSVEFGRYESFIKKSGVPHLGFNDIIDIMSQDYRKRAALLDQFDISVPNHVCFAQPEDGLACIEDIPLAGYVVKVLDGKSLLCENVDIFTWVVKQIPKGIPYVVQDIIPGDRLQFTRWYNGRTFINPSYATYQEGLSSISKISNLITKTFNKLEPFVRKIGHRGPVTLDCIVNDGIIYVIDMNMFIDHANIPYLLEGLKGNLTDFLFELAQGIIKKVELTSDYVLSSKLVVPPHPYNMRTVYTGCPVNGIVKENRNHIAMYCMSKDEQFRIADGNSHVLTVSAHGRDISEAEGRVTRTIDNLSIIDHQQLSYIPGTLSKLPNLIAEQGE
jgi:GTP:adenosylcobinamide-phosphate guanylyltransferase